MGKSQMLRECDVREMLKVMAEIAQLPPDPTARTQHALRGVARLLRAEVSFTTRLRDDGPGKRVQPYAMLVHGYTPAQHDARLTLAAVDPIHDCIIDRLLAADDKSVVFNRRQLDSTQRRARAEVAHRNSREAAGDMNLAIVLSLAQRNHYTALGVNRSDDSYFTDREIQIATLLWRSLRFLHNTPLAGTHPKLWGMRMPPRLSRTLDLTLKGLTAKQIALHLNLSVYTVRDYIKELYQHFGVSGKSELLALFVTPSHRGNESRGTGYDCRNRNRTLAAQTSHGGVLPLGV